MAIDFPASPTVGQEYTSGGMTYVYNGTGWTIKGGSTTALATNAYVDAQDALKVAKAGDTMTGDLNITKDDAYLNLRKLSGNTGKHVSISGSLNNKQRWGITLGDQGAETGVNNAGSDFGIWRADDAGTYIDQPLRITRSSGQVSLTANTIIGGVPAALLDALAYNGMQVNGSMDVSQERGTTPVTVASGLAYIVDGFARSYVGVVDGQISTAQSTDAPAGFANSLKATVVTAKPSFAAGDILSLYTQIEGYRFSRLAYSTASALPMTIAFWCKVNRPGVYSGALAKSDAPQRYYSYTFTMNAANTWEYKTVTVPGDVAAGTWQKTNLPAIRLYWCFGSGTTWMGTPNAWSSTDMYAATGQINGAAATSDYFAITGVCFLPGVQAPTAAQSPLIMRPYDQELLLCQRYYQKLATLTLPGNYTNGGYTFYGGIEFPSMRAIPTAAFSNITYNNSSGLTAVVASISNIRVQALASITGGCNAFFDMTLDARL